MKIKPPLKYWLPGSVSLLTFIVYLASLRNGFVDWDDGPYVFFNYHIRSLNGSFLKWAFLDFYSFNWHPLTWISHAADYAVWGLNPLGHHLTSVILHTVNTFLATLLAARLVDAAGKRATNDRAALIAAGVTGLLFGLHPLHVESAAWIAERKDLLCGFFFLLSAIEYVRFVRTTGRVGQAGCSSRFFFRKDYLLTLGFFILALLSKPMAVTLPAVLLILDWYPFERIKSWTTFGTVCGEKLPFFILSLASSVLTLLAQRSGGALELMEIIPFQTRILVAANSIVAYVGKMVWPLNLMPYYPYNRTVSLVSVQYLGAIGLIVGITAVCAIKIKKQKFWLGAWIYYLVTLVPVLGLVQVGAQSMADRYTYLPSIGPFLAIGLVAAGGWEKVYGWGKWLPAAKITGAAFALFAAVSLSFLTFRQISIWKDDVHLWQHVIDIEHEKTLFAYYKRAEALGKRGRYWEAIEDYNTVIALNREAYSKVYIARGLTYLQVGQALPAIADLDKACSLGDNFGCQAAQYVKNENHR